SVVSVMPSCALERWVDVCLRAVITAPRPRSPRRCLASRSALSRLTSANSEATKIPVPTVSNRPTRSNNQSSTSAVRVVLLWRHFHLWNEYSRRRRRHETSVARDRAGHTGGEDWLSGRRQLPKGAASC